MIGGPDDVQDNARPAYFIGCLCITPCISSSPAPCPMGSPGNELVTVETLGWRPREKKDGRRRPSSDTAVQAWDPSEDGRAGPFVGKPQC
ncbi:unnamed protein product [Gadus morhua 'NCC']